MDKNLALLLIFLACIAVPSWVFAQCGKSSIAALGRNPSAAPKVFTAMIFVMVFAEAAAIISMLVVFQLFSGQ
ncbi:MAG TPA: F0F1 ATP synthase subunit C [Candidatus Omnitrophota bacterium]|jgi:F0F1-type ATP synthase membrane subunit c/vacuolar-type H+-ATPase subunit K|nr:F0F1 ATP synthase subunit C [Candidatus Omnitrophota bacterium]HRZ14481.1 F0F1 ATP synthase subunit C [Candidatus Omnitrophota bacterium]